MANINRTFLVVEGLLHESMAFEQYAGYEAQAVAAADRNETKEGPVLAELLDANGQVMLVSCPDIRYPQGCEPKEVHPGAGFLRIVLPNHPEARGVAVRAYGRTVFESRVGDRVPVLKGLEVQQDPDKKRVLARIQPEPEKGDRLDWFLVTADGRRFPAAAQGKEGDYAIDLSPYAGRGKAQLCVRLTRDMRSTELCSSGFELPESSVIGRIVTPRDGEIWSAGQPGSLVGNLSDENGRPVDWEKAGVYWTVDGERIKDGRPTAFWDTAEPGKYVIEIRQGKDQKETRVLAQVSIEVEKPSESQERFLALLDEYLKDQKRNSS